MNSNDFKKIFFELLTEDQEFQKKLTEFIFAAVAKKFKEQFAQDEEPPESVIIEDVQENSSEDLQAVIDELRAKNKSLESQLANIQLEKEIIESQRDELKTQLAERFAEGWEVYKTFLTLDVTAREHSEIFSESFEAFICSGAQQKRLESLWESALDCKRNGKIDDAEIFWKVFNYCVYLVNTAQGKKFIEVLNTQIGERYDTDKHSTNGTDSSTQGVVKEIILAGYRNNTSGKIVRKSNVRVG